MNRKLLGALAGVSVVVVVVVAFIVQTPLLGTFAPFNVYGRPTPSISEQPADLLPDQAAGFDLITVELSNESNLERARGLYQGGIEVIIVRFSSSVAAADALGGLVALLVEARPENDTSPFTSVAGHVQHWFTLTTTETSWFAWRKGVWVFLIMAPDEAVRNQVVQELPF